MTTPAQKLGLNVGDKAVVLVSNTAFEKGQTVILKEDDGSNNPYFTSEDDSQSSYVSLVSSTGRNRVRALEVAPALPLPVMPTAPIVPPAPVRTGSPAEQAGFVVNVTRLKLSGNDGDYSNFDTYKDMVWILDNDDASSCPYFRSEDGSVSYFCAYVRDMKIIQERAVIGRFKLNESSRGYGHETFSVLTKTPNSSGLGFVGEKQDGTSYHVLTEYWNWVPAGDVPEAVAPEVAKDPEGYTDLQRMAFNTFQRMYDEVVKHRRGDSSRLNLDYGICDNIERFANEGGASYQQMAEVKENLIRTTASWSGDYTYPVKCPNGGSASSAFSNSRNKWSGDYGLNRMLQLGEMIEIIKSEKWNDNLVKRLSPAQRNGIAIGDVVRWTTDNNSLWVLRYDDQSSSPSFHRLGDESYTRDISIENVRKVDNTPKDVSTFLAEIAVKVAEVESLEQQLAKLQAQLKEAKGEVEVLDAGLAIQHKVKRI